MSCSFEKIKRKKYCKGSMRQYITFLEKKESSLNGELNPQFIYNEILRIKAGIKDVTGFKEKDGIQIGQTFSKVFIVNFSKKITSELYIYFKKNLYSIENITNVSSEDRFLEIRTKLEGDFDLSGIN